MATSKKATQSKRAAKPHDAVTTLEADQRKVSALFADLEKARGASREKSMVTQSSQESTVRTTLEAEIFCPLAKSARQDHELVPEADVECASVGFMVAQVQGIAPRGETCGVKVMGESVQHHVEEEQNEMFSKLQKAQGDMLALGAQMAARRRELLASRA